MPIITGDDIAIFDAGFGCGAVFVDAGDQNTVCIVHGQTFGQLGGDFLNPHA